MVEQSLSNVVKTDYIFYPIFDRTLIDTAIDQKW